MKKDKRTTYHPVTLMLRCFEEPAMMCVPCCIAALMRPTFLCAGRLVMKRLLVNPCLA